MITIHDPASLHSVMHPHLVIALQHVFHLLVLVGGVLHCHALVSITDKETCIQEEEQR